MNGAFNRNQSYHNYRAGHLLYSPFVVRACHIILNELAVQWLVFLFYRSQFVYEDENELSSPI